MTSEEIKKNDPVRNLSEHERLELMAQLPAFITYPRTGSQWLEAVMERYFDRPCLRERRATLIDPNRTDWLFFHDHDIDLKLEHDNVLYLYRSPVETVYSFLTYRFHSTRRKSWWGRWRQRNDRPVTPEKVCEMSLQYRDHLEKWLLSPNRARATVRYELLQKNPKDEFKRICDFFDLPFDPERVEATFAAASRERMVAVAVKKRALSESLLSEEYKMGRGEFTERYGSVVRDLVITPELAPAFSYLNDLA